ncbi:hypothetical protein Q7P36_007904 [Cladosporium allicinum]
MPPRKKTTSTPKKEDESSLINPPASPLPTPCLDSTSLRMSYRIARGEQGVLTFEPYKSLLLPYWRFKTVPIARASLAALTSAFDSKYEKSEREGGGKGSRELEKSKGHEGMEEKAEASEVFKRGWEKCRGDEKYGELKREFQREQKEWDKAVREGRVKVDESKDGDVKKEADAIKDEEEEVKVKEESDDG